MQMLNRAKGEESARLLSPDGVTRNGAVLRNERRMNVLSAVLMVLGTQISETGTQLWASQRLTDQSIQHVKQRALTGSCIIS
ncbi:hypothetical protein QQF64_013444 [Cirrhinus molitorella]|uniref:Uncharacterized protein n=1 Tax=Cirrhinus molitorella TaxID=172907 RepID=A0ABR3LR61_9TELE